MNGRWIAPSSSKPERARITPLLRVIDPNTDQFVVVAAGIGGGGTVAAGEFLVDTSRMEELLRQVPAN